MCSVCICVCACVQKNCTLPWSHKGRLQRNMKCYRPQNSHGFQVTKVEKSNGVRRRTLSFLPAELLIFFTNMQYVVLFAEWKWENGLRFEMLYHFMKKYVIYMISGGLLSQQILPCLHIQSRPFGSQLANLFCKGSGKKYFRTAGHAISVATTKLYCCSTEAAMGNVQWMSMAVFQ